MQVLTRATARLSARRMAVSMPIGDPCDLGARAGSIPGMAP
jgi:hypothetical protein